LSTREFELYLRRHTKHPDAVIHQLIDTLDDDNDGMITREEVYKAFKRANEAEGGGEKNTLKEILNLEEDDMADIEDDVYNMFFLSETCSASFWFAIMVFVMKIVLMIIVIGHLFDVEEVPTGSEVPLPVKVAQFILLFVNVSFQEELITTFYIYANLKWSKHILQLNPGASKGKYHCANLMRCIDGLAFLFINTFLLFTATQVLGAFLNFAALGFLSSIDNQALHLARDGYLGDSLETVAGDVLLMKLPKNHNNRLQMMDTILLVITFLITLVAWVMTVILSVGSTEAEEPT